VKSTVLPINLPQGGKLGSMLMSEGMGSDIVQLAIEKPEVMIGLVRAAADFLHRSNEPEHKQSLWRMIYAVWPECACDVPLPSLSCGELLNRRKARFTLIYIAPQLATPQGQLVAINMLSRGAIEGACHAQLKVRYSSAECFGHILGSDTMGDSPEFSGWAWVKPLSAECSERPQPLGQAGLTMGSAGYMALSALHLALYGTGVRKDIPCLLPNRYRANKNAPWTDVLTANYDVETESIILTPRSALGNKLVRRFALETIASKRR